MKVSLITQTLTFWLSLVATLIALISLVFSLKNQRRAQKLDTLQRISQLILKLHEAQSLQVTAIIKSGDLSLALDEFQQRPLPKDTQLVIAQVESEHFKKEQMRFEVQKTQEGLEGFLNEFHAKTDPAKLEALLPKINKLKNQVEIDIKWMTGEIDKLKNLRKAFL